MSVGCGLPDWLGAADRKVRAREKLFQPLCEDADPITSSLAKGIVQHHRDDRWFHQTATFVDMSMQFSLEVRERLGGEAGFRPGLMGHIVIELLLDAWLHEQFPGKLEDYYQAVASVDAERVQATVNQFTKKPTERLVWYFGLFLRERYIFDYADDQRLLYRLNRVFERVKLKPIEGELDRWLPSARSRVYQHASTLLIDLPLALS